MTSIAARVQTLAAIEESHRLYYCRLCHRQVAVCSRCDRGQIYCGEACSQEARDRSIRAAVGRYQKTPQGAMNHARCQEDYRQRQKIVTHQGSPLEPAAAKVLPLSLEAASTAVVTPVESVLVEAREGDQPAVGVGEPEGTKEARAEPRGLAAGQALRGEVEIQEVPRLLRPVPPSSSPGHRHCRFCGRACGPLSRLDFLRERRR